MNWLGTCFLASAMAVASLGCNGYEETGGPLDAPPPGEGPAGEGRPSQTDLDAGMHPGQPLSPDPHHTGEPVGG